MIDEKNIAFAQIDPIVGDINGNIDRIYEAYRKAVDMGAELVVFPECSVIGYPAEDLVLMPSFRVKAMEAIHVLAEYTNTHMAAMLIGSLWEQGDDIYNAALLLEAGKIAHISLKHHLPNEGVFDERRVFMSAPMPNVVQWRGCRIALPICEDIWHKNMISHIADQSPELVIVVNASPFYQGKHHARYEIIRSAALHCQAPVIYVNQCGGQDELVFDGGSFMMDKKGEVIQQLPFFEPMVACATSDDQATPPPDTMEMLYCAMMTGLKGYVEKNGFAGVVIGLSGGIDSALTALVAVDALGKERVHTYMLTSPYTADISVEDAALLAKNLGIYHQELSIAEGMKAVDNMLTPCESQIPSPLAQENIQSRLRGLLLMAISNSTGQLLITTGNKSEMATGYATLYGDMCGAYSVLKDVYKTEVFALSRWRNANCPAGAALDGVNLMPQRIITRPPSAELRNDQKDEDSLPPYDELDAILRLMIEDRAGADEIISRGHDTTTVQHIASLLHRSEYKRRQAPPGVKLTPMSFGRDWRMPLTNKNKR